MRTKDSWGKYLDNCLKEFRNDAGLSQRELSELSGVPKSFINQIENRLYRPSLDAMVRLCAYFDVQVGDIFFIDYEELKRDRQNND